MAKSLYPRPTIKKIVKAQSNRAISKDVDILVFLSYTLFMRSLITEAKIASKKAGETGKDALSARSVRKVREGVLRKYKG
ncbi:unnamed protein product [Periconia digitata]|uniref:Transcription factor CBF/NF-Y/archaeal histone domain-containing protein n=1 Tax=Periconia digitata TaxID=1303443 RepID=A0A9W4U7R9_9PLEO|nr:unnamed protein product [Periconia digitata]